MSTPETPSTRAWWVLSIRAKRFRSSPWTSQISQSGLERSSACEKTRPAMLRSCSSEPGRRQRRVAHVVGEVEVRIVDPERPAGLDRREGELLPEAGDHVQAAAHVLEQVLVGRRRSLEDHDRADVHVRVGRLVRQERRVDRAQPVHVSLCHTRVKPSFSVDRCGRYPSPGRAVHLRKHQDGTLAGPARGAARLLRGRRPRRADGRARARSLRRADLRPQGDRPQQARRARAREARSDLRGGGDRGAGGRDGRLLGPRRRPERPRERREAAAAHDRRDLPAGHQGPRRGAEVRRRRLHDRPDRPRGPRGGRGDDRRGPEEHRPGPDRGGRRRPRGRGPGPDRLHHPDHPLGRRDQLDHRQAEGEVPERGRAEDRRHLLRDHQPPAGGQGAGARSATSSW